MKPRGDTSYERTIALHFLGNATSVQKLFRCLCTSVNKCKTQILNVACHVSFAYKKWMNTSFQRVSELACDMNAANNNPDAA